MLQYYICVGIVLTVVLVLGLGLGFGSILYFVIGTWSNGLDYTAEFGNHECHYLLYTKNNPTLFTGVAREKCMPNPYKSADRGRAPSEGVLLSEASSRSVSQLPGRDGPRRFWTNCRPQHPAHSRAPTGKMFGLFYGRTQASQNDTTDAKRKADGGTLARLKGFLGLEGGSVAESGEGTTERATHQTNRHSKRCGDSVHWTKCAPEFVGDATWINLLISLIKFVCFWARATLVVWTAPVASIVCRLLPTYALPDTEG